MNRNKVICIDLRKFNNEQLTKVSNIVGLVDGCLQENKKNGFIKIFLDDENKNFIGSLLKNPNPLHRNYKGLEISSDYSYLSKKDSEFLLNMPATSFDLKKSKVPELIVEKNSKSPILKEILEVDVILEKIFKYGLSSLSKNEKEYLDKESKK